MIVIVIVNIIIIVVVIIIMSITSIIIIIIINLTTIPFITVTCPGPDKSSCGKDQPYGYPTSFCTKYW